MPSRKEPGSSQPDPPSSARSNKSRQSTRSAARPSPDGRKPSLKRTPSEKHAQERKSLMGWLKNKGSTNKTTSQGVEPSSEAEVPSSSQTAPNEDEVPPSSPVPSSSPSPATPSRSRTTRHSAAEKPKEDLPPSSPVLPSSPASATPTQTRRTRSTAVQKPQDDASMFKEPATPKRSVSTRNTRANQNESKDLRSPQASVTPTRSKSTRNTRSRQNDLKDDLPSPSKEQAASTLSRFTPSSRNNQNGVKSPTTDSKAAPPSPAARTTRSTRATKVLATTSSSSNSYELPARTQESTAPGSATQVSLAVDEHPAENKIQSDRTDAADERDEPVAQMTEREGTETDLTTPNARLDYLDPPSDIVESSILEERDTFKIDLPLSQPVPTQGKADTVSSSQFLLEGLEGFDDFDWDVDLPVSSLPLQSAQTESLAPGLKESKEDTETRGTQSEEKKTEDTEMTVADPARSSPTKAEELAAKEAAAAANKARVDATLARIEAQRMERLAKLETLANDDLDEEDEEDDLVFDLPDLNKAVAEAPTRRSTRKRKDPSSDAAQPSDDLSMDNAGPKRKKRPQAPKVDKLPGFDELTQNGKKLSAARKQAAKFQEMAAKERLGLVVNYNTSAQDKPDDPMDGSQKQLDQDTKWTGLYQELRHNDLSGRKTKPETFATIAKRLEKDLRSVTGQRKTLLDLLYHATESISSLSEATAQDMLLLATWAPSDAQSAISLSIQSYLALYGLGHPPLISASSQPDFLTRLARNCHDQREWAARSSTWVNLIQAEDVSDPQTLVWLVKLGLYASPAIARRTQLVVHEALGPMKSEDIAETVQKFGDLLQEHVDTPHLRFDILAALGMDPNIVSWICLKTLCPDVQLPRDESITAAPCLDTLISRLGDRQLDVFKDPSGNAALRDFDYIDTETRLIGRVFHDFSRYLLKFAKGDSMTDAEQQSAVNQLVSRIDVALNVLGDLTFSRATDPFDPKKAQARESLNIIKYQVAQQSEHYLKHLHLPPRAAPQQPNLNQFFTQPRAASAAEAIVIPETPKKTRKTRMQRQPSVAVAPTPPPPVETVAASSQASMPGSPNARGSQKVAARPMPKKRNRPVVEEAK